MDPIFRKQGVGTDPSLNPWHVAHVGQTKCIVSGKYLLYTVGVGAV